MSPSHQCYQQNHQQVILVHLNYNIENWVYDEDEDDDDDEEIGVNGSGNPDLNAKKAESGPKMISGRD
jgi:hypothetical protein